METEYKLFVMHEQTSNSDNLVITESLNRQSSHTLSKLDISTATNDNHTLEATEHNQSSPNNNNRTLTKATNTVVRGIVDFKKLNRFDTSRHEESSATAVVLSYSEDNINNNCGHISTGVGVMSHNSFVLSFDHQPSPSSETLLSPAEAPFGRRYAEISQFKNHPNVEW